MFELSELHRDDLAHVVGRIPRDVAEVMSRYPVALAGGFVRAVVAGETPNDLDLFSAGNAEALEAAHALVDKRGEGRMVSTPNAVTVLSPGRLAVQFITRWTFPGDARAVASGAIESFDFTVCQAAVYLYRSPAPSAWGSVCASTFYVDLASRRLRYTAPKRDEDQAGSLIRVVKYAHRGYNIQADSLALVVLRSVRGLMEAPAFTDEQLEVALRARIRVIDPAILPSDGGPDL